MEPTKLAYNIPEAAQALGIGRSMLYQFLASGEIESFYLGKRRLIQRQALEEFLARRRRGEIAA